MLALECFSGIVDGTLTKRNNSALYATFASPWTDGNNIHVEPEYHLPPCYNVQLPPPAQGKISSFSDETLFYIFYAMPRDALQEAAAQELFNRNWRYHKEWRIWLTKDPNSEPKLKTPTHERGVYIYFDPNIWERAKKEYLLVYDALEDRRNPLDIDSSRVGTGKNALAE